MTDDIDISEDTAGQQIETALDLAFERARANPDETPAFYDALFSATIFLPIEGAYDEAGEESTEDASSIAPILYEIEDLPTLMIFDTEDRLARWAEEPLDYVGMTGRQLFSMFDSEQQVALNLGVAPSSVVIPQEVVEWLHERAQDPLQAEEVAQGSSIDVTPPPELPSEALARITARIAGLRRDLDEAVIFSLAIDDEQEAAHRRIVLGIVPSEAGAEGPQAIASALAEAAQGAFSGERPVEIALLNAESELMEKAREVGLVLPVAQIGMLH